ncbi:MAG: hypothetical protein KBD50_01435 [Candidatus Pacebacteria bacterium]|nr:hypothetical protein [Candidatus Paceibacterota bacterium]
MRRMFVSTYEFVETLPDRFYPFANDINGRRIRGIRSYKKAVQRALKKNGVGRLGYKLMVYRQTFHFIGSLLFIVFATLISQDLFGSEAALYALLCMAIIALTYQEFYLHPRKYGQRVKKGVIDWCVWIAPMLVYIFR